MRKQVEAVLKKASYAWHGISSWVFGHYIKYINFHNPLKSCHVPKCASNLLQNRQKAQKHGCVSFANLNRQITCFQSEPKHNKFT